MWSMKYILHTSHQSFEDEVYTSYSTSILWRWSIYFILHIHPLKMKYILHTSHPSFEVWSIYFIFHIHPLKYEVHTSYFTSILWRWSIYFIFHIHPLKMKYILHTSHPSFEDEKYTSYFTSILWRWSINFILHIQLMKMELIECSETSANHNQTQGKYPKEYIQDSKHSESLKSRM